MADELDEELSPEEEKLLRFQFENEVALKAAQLGVDMDHFVHVDPAGRQLIETAIDELQRCMIELIDVDLLSPEARKLQTEAKGYKCLIEFVRVALEVGRDAITTLEEESAEE